MPIRKQRQREDATQGGGKGAGTLSATLDDGGGKSKGAGTLSATLDDGGGKGKGGGTRGVRGLK